MNDALEVKVFQPFPSFRRVVWKSSRGILTRSHLNQQLQVIRLQAIQIWSAFEEGVSGAIIHPRADLQTALTE
jgi:hypothetical protein